MRVSGRLAVGVYDFSYSRALRRVYEKSYSRALHRVYDFSYTPSGHRSGGMPSLAHKFPDQLHGPLRKHIHMQGYALFSKTLYSRKDGIFLSSFFPIGGLSDSCIS